MKHQAIVLVSNLILPAIQPPQARGADEDGERRYVYVLPAEQTGAPEDFHFWVTIGGGDGRLVEVDDDFWLERRCATENPVKPCRPTRFSAVGNGDELVLYSVTDGQPFGTLSLAKDGRSLRRDSQPEVYELDDQKGSAFKPLARGE